MESRQTPADSPEALGELVSNFHFLEFALRLALYFADTKPADRLPLSFRLASLRVGDRLPVSHLSSWATLGQLIDAYNRHPVARGASPEVDPTLVTMRDTIAHGRVLADETGGPPVAVKFQRPAPDATDVAVSVAIELSLDRLNFETERVAVAAKSVLDRAHELGRDTPR